MKNNKYFAVLSNGKVVESESWKDLKVKILPENDVDMFGAFYYGEPYITQYGNEYYWAQIQILNEDERPTTYQKGVFKITRIYKDEGSYYFKGRKIEIENCITNEVIKHYITSNDQPDFITAQEFYIQINNILKNLNKEFSRKIIY